MRRIVVKYQTQWIVVWPTAFVHQWPRWVMFTREGQTVLLDEVQQWMLPPRGCDDTALLLIPALARKGYEVAFTLGDELLLDDIPISYKKAGLLTLL